MENQRILQEKYTKTLYSLLEKKEEKNYKKAKINRVPQSQMPPNVLGFYDTITKEITLPTEQNTPEHFLFPDERKFVEQHEIYHSQAHGLGRNNETNADNYAAQKTGYFGLIFQKPSAWLKDWNYKNSLN